MVCGGGGRGGFLFFNATERKKWRWSVVGFFWGGVEGSLTRFKVKSCLMQDEDDVVVVVER